MAKNIVIMNKQHSLTEEQEKILKEKFNEFRIMFVDEKGWTLDYMRNLTLNKNDNFIFVSPVPYLLARLCKEQYKVFLFHNDKRDKKELPDGKVIYTVSKTGWELVEI